MEFPAKAVSIALAVSLVWVRLPFDKRRLLAVWSLVFLYVLRTGAARGDIFYYDPSGTTHRVIPGTQGIVPGPGIDLSGWNSTSHTLYLADLSSKNLTNASFANSDLSDASFYSSTLRNADFTGAIIRGADFGSPPSAEAPGLTAAQLYSTASYQAHDLTGIGLESGPEQINDLTGWNLANQNLTNARFSFSILTNANFAGAIIRAADFSASGLTANQLYSTATYATGDLSGIVFGKLSLFGGSDLSGWNFTHKNLTNAQFVRSNLSGVDFTGAVIKGADFGSVVGFTAAQFYSTASYASGDLTGIGLEENFLDGWNLSHLNLTGANFFGTGLSLNAPATNAKLEFANFSGANLTYATFSGVYLTNNNFTNANLANAMLNFSSVSSNDFTGADLRGAQVPPDDGTNVLRNTIRPDGSIQGLKLLAGDKLIVRNSLIYFPVPHSIPVTVTTDAEIGPGAAVQFVLDTNWTSPVSFSGGLTPSLGGALDLEFADSVDPRTLLFDSFQLFKWNGPLPAGDQFSTIITQPGLQWDLSALYTAGVVRLTAIVPEPSALLLSAAGLVIGLIGARRFVSRRRSTPARCRSSI